MNDRPDERGDQPPMLRLGEDRPEVEDTTPEQLAEQQAELVRQRAQLVREAEKERERSQKRLAGERQEAERALSRRQREIDDAERRLQRTERRLRQEAERLGRAHEVPSVRPTGRTSGRHAPSTGARKLLAGARASSGRRVLRGPAVLLALSSVALTAGTALSAVTPSAEALSSFSDADEARALMYQAALAMDEEMLRHDGQEELPSDEDGELLSIVLTNQAVALNDDFSSFARDDIVEHGQLLLQTDAVSPVRAASSWNESRRRATSAVPSYRITEDRESLQASGAGTVLMWTGAGLLAVAALLLALGGTWVAAAVALLALLPAGLVLATDPRLDGAYSDASSQHDEAIDRARDTVDQVGFDLELVLGLRSLQAFEQPTDYSPGYWGEGRYGLDFPEGFTQVRSELGQVLEDESDPQQVNSAALGVVGSGEQLLETYEQDAAQARAAVVASRERPEDSGGRVPALLAAIALPFIGLGLSSMRKRGKTT